MSWLAEGLLKAIRAAAHGTAPAPPHGPSRTAPAPPRTFAEENLYGEALPFVVGTDRVKGQLVYHGPISAALAQAWTWDPNGDWKEVQAVFSSLLYAICEAPVTDIPRIWKGANPPDGILETDWSKLLANNAGTTATKILDAAGAVAWSEYVGTSAEGMGHSGTAQLRFKGVAMKADGTPPDLEFEVKGYGAGAGGESTWDAHPADVLTLLVTDGKRGLGLSSSVLNVDTGISGTAADSYRRYCSARGWYVSKAFTDRGPVLDSIGQLLLATDSTPVLIDGKVTIIPMGDQTVTRAGFTFTPTLTPVTIDYSELLHQEGEDLVRWERVPPRDIYGVWPVRFRNRAKAYATETREYIDPVWTAKYGTRRAPVIDLDWVFDISHAFWITFALAQRATRQRNKATFRLGARWSLLTGMDFVSLVEPQGTTTTVRILTAEEQDDRSLEVVAVEWPSNTAEPVDLTQQAADGLLTPNLQSYRVATQDLANVNAGAIPRDKSTPGQDWDNLWPNANSEVDPPPGADASAANPEFGLRANVGANAYAGNWVRLLAAGQPNSPVLTVACSPGHAFYIEAMVKSVSDAAEVCWINIDFLNAAGGIAGTYHSPYAFAPGTSWVPIAFQATAPAAAVKVVFKFTHSSATSDFYIDALYVRRIVAGPVIADGGVTTPKLADGGVSKPKLSAANYQLSDSCGAWSRTQPNGWAAVTNLSVTITTSGRPVLLMLVGDGNVGSYIGCGGASSAAGDGSEITFKRSGTNLGTMYTTKDSAGSYWACPPGAAQIDAPAAGTYTYTVEVRAWGSANAIAYMYQLKLLAMEL